MVELSLEQLLPRSGWSVYRLSRLAAVRALELAEGRPSLIGKINTDKPTTIALEEIRQGKVMLKSVADAQKGKKVSVQEPTREVVTSV